MFQAFVKTTWAQVWKTLKENTTPVACVLLFSHNCWWWFNKPTVLTTVTYLAVVAWLSYLAPRRWLSIAWIILMLLMAAINSKIVV